MSIGAMFRQGRMPQLFAALVFLIGFLVFTSIALGPVPDAVASWLPATKANSAVCFMVLAISLLTLPVPGPPLRWHSARVSTIASVSVLAVTFITVVQYVADIDLGIDQLLLTAIPTTPPSTHPGRMALGTSILFLLYGSALLLLAGSNKVVLGQGIAWTGLLLDMFPLAGYLYGASPLYALFGYTRIPLASVLAFAAVGVGILAATSHRGIVQVLFSHGVGGQLARRLIPLAILLPFLFGYIRLLGQRAGWFQTEVGLAIFALTNSIAFTGLIFWGTRWLDKADDERRRAAEAVKKSERRYRALVLAAPQSVWTITESEFQADPTIWLQKITEQTDEPGGEAHLLDAIHPDDRRKVEIAWNASRQERLPFDLVFRIRAESGHYRHLSICAVALHDDQGRFEEWVGTNTDVTQKEEFEKIRRESETRLRNLADSMPQIVWSVDADGVIDYYNRRWFEYTRTTDSPENLDAWSQVIHPSDVEGLSSRWRESLATGITFQAVFRLREGGSDSYRWHLGRALPIADEQGRIIRWYGTCTDIDKHKKTERALRSIRKRLESLVMERTQDLVTRNLELKNEVEERHRLEQAHLAVSARLSAVLNAATHVSIIATNLNGTITVFNTGAEMLLGYSAEEMVGIQTPVVIHLASELHEQEDRLSREMGRPVLGFEAFVAKATIIGHETRDWTYIRKDGSRFPVSLTVTAQRDERGKVVGYLGVGVDLSERKRSEIALQQAKEVAEAANRAKSEFLANMSHEIRTPMNGILGMTEHVLSTPLTDEQRDQLSAVRESGQALLAIINNILDFSKIEAERLELDPVEFRLRDGVFDVIKTLVAHGHDKGLTVDCFVMPDVPEYLRGDFSRLCQIIINLVGNAIKFTEKGGVTLVFHPEERSDCSLLLHVEVRDTGIGIPETKLADIFRPFEQVDGSMARRYGGTGLGLSISARLVQLLGGHIWVESQLGKGSTFHFVIPLEVLSDRAEEWDQDLVSLMKDCRVLVVDANETSRSILSRTLTSWGIAPTLVSRLSEARVLLSNGTSSPPFRIVVVDGAVVGIDDREILGEMAKEIGIVVLATPAQMRGNGGVDGKCIRLLKPVTPSDLFAVLGKILGGEPAEENSAFDSTNAALSPRRLLLVEDYVINQKVAVGMLRKHGHHVSVANNGREAIDAIARESFDLVLMDVQMPVMDGLEATARIRESERRTGRHLPIIALTAHAMKGDRERFMAAGMDECVTKPIQAQELLRVIDAFTAEGSAGSVIDPNRSMADPLEERTLRQRFDGYGPLLRDVLDVFPAECSRILAELTHRVEQGDREALGRSAHALRGCLLNVCANEAAQLATELEDLCPTADWESIRESQQRLSSETHRVIDAARTMRESMPEFA
ncbi:MAG: PAS domain S-box protein [Planctomycetota bacterium]